MNDTPEPEQPEKKSILSAEYAAFLEALEALYVPGNMSGRLHFTQGWPKAAQFLFGLDLVRLDVEGIGIEKEQRDALEEVAMRRQHKLLEIAHNLEVRSVVEGSLQSEYVERLVKAIGRDVALLLYVPEIVDRFLPENAAGETAEKPQSEGPVFPKFEDLKKRLKDMDS